MPFLAGTQPLFAGIAAAPKSVVVSRELRTDSPGRLWHWSSPVWSSPVWSSPVLPSPFLPSPVWPSLLCSGLSLALFLLVVGLIAWNMSHGRRGLAYSKLPVRELPAAQLATVDHLSQHVPLQSAAQLCNQPPLWARRCNRGCCAPEMPPPPSPPPMTADECDEDPISIRRAQIADLSTEAYDELEQSNLARLRALPNVTKVDAFSRGRRPNDNGVRVNLSCTSDCKQQQQPQMRCRKDVPTRAHVAELLYTAISESHTECIQDRTRWNQGESSSAPTAFTHITSVRRKASEVEAAEQREKAHHAEVIAAKAAVEAAQDRELQAAKEREVLEASLAELKASFRPNKTARTEVQDAEDISPDAEESESVDPEAWETYRIQMFRSLFRKYRKTSTKPINPNNTDTQLPAQGDDNGRRGWRNHGVRGLYGAIRHWADGSPFRVSFMLAELIVYFGVQDAVSVPAMLGLNGPALLGSAHLQCMADGVPIIWQAGSVWHSRIPNMAGEQCVAFAHP